MDNSVPFYSGTGTGEAPVSFSLPLTNSNSYYIVDTDEGLPSYSSAPLFMDYTSKKSESATAFYTEPADAITRPARSLTYPFNPSASSPYSLASAASFFPGTESMRASEESPSASLAPVSVDHFPSMVSSHSRSQRFASFRSLFPRFSPKGVSKAEKEINRCLSTVQKSAQFFSSRSESEDFLNRHQCDLLVRRLRVTGNTLAEINQSPLLDENTVPALEELYQSLSDAEKLITMSSIDNTSQWLRAAIERGDLKETFANLLYNVEWCTSILQSILVENSKESRIEFEPTLCNCQLSSGDELALLTAMKEDEGNLERRLESSVRHLQNSMERRFATKLLGKIKARSPGLVFLNPDDLDLDGAKIGEGAFGQVKESNLLDITCALKGIYLDDSNSENVEIGKEMDAIKKLGNHPHIVRHFCYSKTENDLYLIMEKLQMDLEKVLRRKKKNGDGLSVLEAVSLMLQIGEGVKYIHGKGVAHRDLKPGNVLVNLVDPSSRYLSRICSVKIADFGSTKLADRTLSNQTVGTGTTKYMAPEVMKQDGDPKKAKFNPLKADVYSFAILSAEILTGRYPHSGSLPRVIMELSKAGKRPILPNDCPVRLSTLLCECWAQKSNDRPLFPEICKELRYIKGLLLKGDQQKLQTPFPGPLRPMERVKLQGPWGGQNGLEFIDMATSIKSIRLRYQSSPGVVGLMEVSYEILGKAFKRKYVQDGPYGNENVTIDFKPENEYIKQIRGFVNVIDMRTKCGKKIQVTIVASLTIQTNLGRYGPFGEEEGTPFTSDQGSRVIGFHGKAGNLLQCLGVVTIPDI